MEVDLCREVPESDQIKMIRMIASKTALTARIDACRTYPSGEQGKKFRDNIVERYAKISGPQQARLTKVLPKPDDKPRKKRGGAKKRN